MFKHVNVLFINYGTLTYMSGKSATKNWTEQNTFYFQRVDSTLFTNTDICMYIIQHTP